tara:strand:+ start:10887 stop:11030 length:144 start_codon:yes stop_codon:yes gene_type:complete
MASAIEAGHLNEAQRIIIDVAVTVTRNNAFNSTNHAHTRTAFDIQSE